MTSADIGQARRLATDLTIEAWGCLSAVAGLLRRPGSPPATGPELRPGDSSRPPVMLVHGLAADRSCFDVMESQLHRTGYTTLSVDYSSRGVGIEECAWTLVQDAAWVLTRTGWDRVHVVAHSLGGVVLRWAVTNTVMRDWVVPVGYAALPESGNVRNTVVPSGGHLSLTTNPHALSIVLQELATAGRHASRTGLRQPTAQAAESRLVA